MAGTTTAIAGAKVEERAWKFAFGMAMFASLMNWLPTLGFTPMLPMMQTELNMSFTQLGFFAGLQGVVGLIFSIPYGIFTRRYGVKTASLVGLGFVALGLALLTLATEFYMGSAGRAVWMFGYRAAQIGLFAAIAIVAPQRVMASMMGVTFAMANVGTVLGAPIGGYMGANFGWRSGIWVFFALTVVAMVIFALLFRPAAQAAPAPAPAATAKADSAPAQPAGRSAYFRGTAWLLALLFALNAMTVASIIFFVPAVLVRVYGLSVPQVATVITVGFGIAAGFTFASGFVADRLMKSTKWTIVLFMVPIIFLAAVGLNIPNVTVFIGSVILLLMLGAAGPGLIYSMPPKLFPAREMGPVYAIMTIGASTSSYFGPQILGILRDATGGFTIGWYFIASMGVLAIVEIIILRKKLP